MRFEIRKSGGKQCDTCGAHEIVYAGGAPVSADVTRILENEITLRDIEWAKLLRDFIAASRTRQDATEGALVAQFKSEHWGLTMRHADQLDEIAALIEDTKVLDVPKWRLARRRRERLFAERVDKTVQDMLELTVKANA